MGYVLLVLYLLLAFVRPGDLYPELAAYRYMLVVGIVALLGSGFSLITGRGPTFRSPQTYLLLVFGAWVPLTVALTGWLGGGLAALIDILPILIPFFLLLFNADSAPRIRHVAALLVVLMLIQTCQGISAFHFADKLIYNRFILTEWRFIPDVINTPEAANRTDLGEYDRWIPWHRRIRGLGFMQDPNDLAQAILSVLPFLTVLWRRGRPLRNVLVVLLPAAVLLYGVLLTKSRGGQLAFVVLLFAMFQRHLGRALSLTLSGIGLALIMTISVGGRAIQVDESALDRVEAWYVGLELLKAHPISGVGYERFVDYSPRVAHNSYVQCFAELGLVGYYVWLALLVVTLLDLRRVERLASSDAPPELVDWARAVRLGLIAFLAAAFFLSRTYSPMLFILLGLATAVVDVARKQPLDVRPLPFVVIASLVAVIELLSVVVVYASVRGIGT